MSKVTEIKRLNDFVRFSFDVTIEEPGIKVFTNVNGTVEHLDGSASKYVLLDIDDVYHRKVELFGKDVKISGFSKMYEELFSEGYEAFEDRLDKAAEKAVHTQFNKNIANLSKADLTNLLVDRLEEVKPVDGYVEGAHGKEYYEYYQDFTLFNLWRLLGKPTASFRKDGFDRGFTGIKATHLNDYLISLC